MLHTINARYSPKYFGLMKGIVAYTLVANHIPVSARIIGALDWLLRPIRNINEKLIIEEWENIQRIIM